MLKDISTQSPKSIDYNLHTQSLTKMIKLRDTKGLLLKSFLVLAQFKKPKTKFVLLGTLTMEKLSSWVIIGYYKLLHPKLYSKPL